MIELYIVRAPGRTPAQLSSLLDELGKQGTVCNVGVEVPLDRDPRTDPEGRKLSDLLVSNLVENTEFHVAIDANGLPNTTAGVQDALRLHPIAANQFHALRATV